MEEKEGRRRSSLLSSKGERRESNTFGKYKNQFNWRNFTIVFFVAFGQLCFGYPASVISVILNNQAWLEYMGLTPAETSASTISSYIGATNGVFQAGALINTFITQIVMDRWGRKICGYYNCFFGILGGALLVGSTNIGMFIAARFFTGWSAWGFLILTPIYTAELSPPALRGFFVGLNGVNISLGYALAGYIGTGFFYADSAEATWRGPLGLYLLFPISMVVILFFSPESPRYLLMKGEEEKARDITFRLHTIHGNDEYAREEMYEMKKQSAIDRTLQTSWLSLFTKPSYRRRTWICMFYCFIGQSTGVLVINNYGPIFYESLGYGPEKQLSFQCGWLTLGPPFCLLGAYLMDRVGRRTLMLIGIGGCCLSMIVETAAGAHLPSQSMGALGVAAFYVFLVLYSVGVDVGGNVFYAEVFPTHIRSKGVAITNAVLAAADLVYLQCADTAIANIQWKYFLVFVIISGLGWIVLYFTLPETKGLPLEEIGGIFGDDEVAIYKEDFGQDDDRHSGASKPGEDLNGGLEKATEGGAEHKDVLEKPVEPGK